MQSYDNSKANSVVPLSVSEQLNLLIESKTANDVDNYSKKPYLFAVIIGGFADLFILNKISFGNNRIKLNNNPKKVNKFLTEIMKEIISYRGDISLFYILQGMNNKRISKINSMINKGLIHKNLLVNEHETAFGKKSCRITNEDFKFDLYENTKMYLDKQEQPPNQLLYLLTLLHGINLLPELFTSKKELNYARNQLQLFIKNNSIAQLLLRAIQNEIKVTELENMSKHQNIGFSIGRIF